MIMTMRPDVASRYARSNNVERKNLVDKVQAELRRIAPSIKVVGSINYSTRIIIDEHEVERLRSRVSDQFLVEADYKMVTL